MIFEAVASKTDLRCVPFIYIRAREGQLPGMAVTVKPALFQPVFDTIVGST